MTRQRFSRPDDAWLLEMARQEPGFSIGEWTGEPPAPQTLAGPTFKPSTDRLVGEREARIRNASRRIYTGVPYLDKSMGGIAPSSLVLLGGLSGSGKTEMAAQIAKANVEAGKRVHYFALEAEDREIERRMLFREIAKRFYADPNRPKIYLNYRDWYFAELDDELEPYETAAQIYLNEKCKTLHTLYRTQGIFGIQEADRAFREIEGQTDLAIFDHLNYFDLDSTKSENEATTELIKRVRDLALITQIPTVMVAHLRKKDRKSEALMPDLEDFMGSSNVYKIPTQAIILAPAKVSEAAPPTPGRWPTYMRVVKNRIDGSLTRYIAHCTFNSETNTYDRTYSLGYYHPGQTEFVPINDFKFMPHWAKPMK